jgi:hypothetical protein
MVLALGLLPATALASPRDDMLAGIARCNAFADERTFLDCVYGAAQPVRAELGLAPALPDQVRLVPREMAPRETTSPGAARTPAAGVSAPPAEGAPERGFVDRLLGSGKPVTAPTAMRSYSFDRDGLFTVTLSNGEVWRQADGDFEKARWNKPAGSYVVSVVSGAAGTSNLEVQGEAGFYKVKRQR